MHDSKHSSPLRRLHWSLVPALAAAMLLFPGSGCKNKNYPQCKKDKHCKVELGEKCVDGSCQNCQTDADCTGKGPEGGPAWVCHEFRCMDPAEAAGAGGSGSPGEMGSPCAQTVDCVGGLVCTAGSCAGCTDDIECSPSTCNFETGRCAAAGQCTTDDQCPMDEICDGGMCIFSGTEPGAGGGPCSIDAVYFAFDSDALTPKSQEELSAASACIAEQGQEVILEAHADAVGTEEYNIMLTERRGGSVRTFLVDKGVPGELLRVLAKGSLEATGSNESERAKDRRVQLIWP
ncbi:MAG: OmpA family protein [Myxococcales bacterium]|nr:OmpA family protein [Myxococcales bacterium]MCB9718332.1 OmpA family protein [Myxococcales bacterium]